MQDRGARNTIFDIRKISEGIFQQNQHFYLVFMDYQKPLDKVHHHELWKTLSHIDDMEMCIVRSVFHDHYTAEDTKDRFTPRKDGDKDVSCGASFDERGVWQNMYSSSKHRISEGTEKKMSTKTHQMSTCERSCLPQLSQQAGVGSS